MANKYLALQKDVFDINKVTVVGSPTITEDGVASGFSATNYLQIPMPNLAQYNTWEIICKFKMNVVNESGMVFTFASSKANQVVTQTVYNKNLGMAIGNSTGTAWQIVEGTAHGTTIIEPNKTYWSKIKFTGTSFDLMLSTNGINYNLEYSYASTQNISYNSSYNFNIASARAGGGSHPDADIYLEEFTIIGDGELVYSPTKPTYLLERRKPKVWNKGQFTIVGNPSISDSGVYTCGYDKASYVKIHFDNTANNFHLTVKIDIKDSKQSGYYLGYSHNTTYGCFNANFNGAGQTDFRIIVLDEQGNIQTLSMGATTYQVGTETIELDFNGSRYLLTRTSANGTVKTYAVNSTLKPATNFFSLGCSNNADFAPSTVNLKNITITSDNNLVFDGGAETYVYDPSKFTIAGSPTITEYGVATYITGQNYVYIPPIDYTKPFAIKKMGFALASWGGNYYFVNGGNTNKDFMGFVIGTNGATQKLRWFLGSTGTSWNIVNARESVTTLELNTLYYVDLIYSGEDYTVILYDNIFRELERMTVTSSTPLYQSGKGIMIGSNYINSTTYNGNIYLANITVENDGKEVFTGAKEQFYMLSV